MGNVMRTAFEQSISLPCEPPDNLPEDVRIIECRECRAERTAYWLTQAWVCEECGCRHTEQGALDV